MPIGPVIPVAQGERIVATSLRTGRAREGACCNALSLRLACAINEMCGLKGAEPAFQGVSRDTR